VDASGTDDQLSATGGTTFTASFTGSARLGADGSGGAVRNDLCGEKPFVPSSLFAATRQLYCVVSDVPRCSHDVSARLVTERNNEAKPESEATCREYVAAVGDSPQISLTGGMTSTAFADGATSSGTSGGGAGETPESERARLHGCAFDTMISESEYACAVGGTKRTVIVVLSLSASVSGATAVVVNASPPELNINDVMIGGLMERFLPGS